MLTTCRQQHPFFDCEQLFLRQQSKFYEVENSTMLVAVGPTIPRSFLCVSECISGVKLLPQVFPVMIPYIQIYHMLYSNFPYLIFKFTIPYIQIYDILYSNLLHLIFKFTVSVAQCKSALSPLLMHWRYCSLALSHQYVIFKFTTDQYLTTDLSHL